MAETLSQAEIDALLSSLKESTASPAASAPVAEEPPAPIAKTTAPFASIGDLRPVTARRLMPIGEGFARHFEKILPALLHLPVQVSVTGFARVTGPVSAHARLLIEPNALPGAISLNDAFGQAVCDRLLGGQLKASARPIGELELVVLKPVFNSVAQSMTYGLRAHGLLVVVAPNEEPPVESGLKMEFNVVASGLNGSFSVVLPDFLHATPEADEAATPEAPANEAVIELGRTTITAQELLTLKVGDMLKLDRHADADLTLTLGEATLHGRPVLDGERLLFTLNSTEEWN